MGRVMETNRTSRDLVLVGGGHSHVQVLESLAAQPLPAMRTTLISREVMTPYSGMLPGFIAGHYASGDMHIDLAPLCAAAGVRLIHDEVRGVDLDSRRVLCAEHPALHFDLLSINAGSAPATGTIHGADRIGIAVKPIHRFIPQWEALLGRLRAKPDRPVRVAVVGGGASGVELALAIDHRLRVVEGLEHVEMMLISAARELLVGHSPRAGRLLLAELQRRGFDVHLGARVVAAETGVVETDVDGRLHVDEVLWATQAVPQSWPGDAGLVVDADGFVLVNDLLQSVSDPAVFVTGDAATIDGHRRPKSGVFAVRQGAALARNLRSIAAGDAPAPFRPQKHYLALISTGDRRAVAVRGAWVASGRWVWRWKDRIDRRFIARFRPGSRHEPSAGLS